jgi:hypothetical protein
MSAAKSARVRGTVFFRAFSALVLMAGVFAAAAITFEGTAGADTPPTIATGTAAFSTDPVVNLTSCTGTTSSTTLTCTSTSGVVATMGAYGASLASGTSVSSVTPTTIVLSADPSAAVTAGPTLTFTTRTAVGNVSGSTTSVTSPNITSSNTWTDASVTVGQSVVGPGIAAGTTVASVSTTSLTLSAAPSPALSGATLIFNSPETFDALTLVSGGASSVNTSSLTVVSQPPAADGVVTATPSSSHGLLTLLPGDGATSTFTSTFAYCAPGDTYSPGSPNCTIGTLNYAPATDQELGEAVSVSIETEDIYENTEVAAVQPATASQGSTYTATLAPVGSSIPSSQSSSVGNIVVNYGSGFATVIPAPAGVSFVPGSATLSGGDASTEGQATIEYCTAAGTGCDAQINTGNYKTTYPYLELELGSSVHIAGGSNFTLPTVTARFTASGSVGTTASEKVTEFKLNTNVTAPVIGTTNVTFDGYPSTGNADSTPPYSPPVALGSTQIVAAPAAPTITSGANTTFTAGSGGSFQVTTTGNPAPALSESGPLPSGVTFTDNGNGTASLAGTPAAGTGGTYPISITANNGVTPNATQSFTLTVDQAPAITSGSSTTFTTGTSGSFTVTSTGFPTASVSESGALPSGVTFANNGDGTATISGTPAGASGGVYPITFTANNGVNPSASQSFTLTVDQAPALTSADNVTFDIGESNSFTVTASGYPAPALSESGDLPGTVTLTDNGNGTATLSGDPGGSPQDYPITITASNGVGSDANQSFTLTASNAPQAPTITSAADATFTVGAAGSYTVTTVGNPAASLSESGTLPSGLTFADNGDGTGTLAGTPAAGTGGVYDFTVTASNGVSPDANQSFTVTVNEAPSITSGDASTFTAGTNGTFSVTTSGYPVAAITESGNLPSGVTLTDNGDGTATISGTPAAGTGGTYAVTVGASNGVSPDASQSFTLTVNEAPSITSGASTTFTVGTNGSVTVTSTGFPTAALSETGSLPSGVTFTDNSDGTGTLSGSPATGTGGVYVVTLHANNGIGTAAKQTFTLTVDESAGITSGSNTTFKVGKAGSFTVMTSGYPAGAITENGGLPSGVTFTDNGDGTATLAGTAAAHTGGVYPITFSADNGVGSAANQSFSLTVDEAPYFTSANSVTFSQKQLSGFQVTAAGYPALTSSNITEWGTLPKGMTFTHGIITGTPKKKGTFQILLTASNGINPNGTQIFTITVVGFGITTTSLPPATEGTPYSAQLQAQGGATPYKWVAVGSLPTGLTLSKHGLLSGTVPDTVPQGNVTINVKATDHSSPVQTATASLTLTIQAAS